MLSAWSCTRPSAPQCSTLSWVKLRNVAKPSALWDVSGDSSLEIDYMQRKISCWQLCSTSGKLTPSAAWDNALFWTWAPMKNELSPGLMSPYPLEWVKQVSALCTQTLSIVTQPNISTSNTTNVHRPWPRAGRGIHCCFCPGNALYVAWLIHSHSSPVVYEFTPVCHLSKGENKGENSSGKSLAGTSTSTGTFNLIKGKDWVALNT